MNWLPCAVYITGIGIQNLEYKDEKILAGNFKKDICLKFKMQNISFNSTRIILLISQRLGKVLNISLM